MLIARFLAVPVVVVVLVLAVLLVLVVPVFPVVQVALVVSVWPIELVGPVGPGRTSNHVGLQSQSLAEGAAKALVRSKASRGF